MSKLLLPITPGSPMFIDKTMTVEWQNFFRDLFVRTGGYDASTIQELESSGGHTGLYNLPMNYDKEIKEGKVKSKSTPIPKNYDKEIKELKIKLESLIPRSYDHILKEIETTLIATPFTPLKVGDVIAAANITDHRVVRGDGGARGVQETTIIVSDNGEMTNPSQPAFSAKVNTAQLNETGDGTSYGITGAFWTERFDQNNDFLNGTFTAPVDGRYQLSGVFDVEGLTAAHTRGRCYVVTSNVAYEVINLNFGAIKESGNRAYLPFSILVDMDAADTAFLQVAVLNGAKTVDICTRTYFTGVLIC